MTRITVVWTLSLLLLSGAASADPQPWMEKENPDELPTIFGFSTNCPEEEDSTYLDIALGVLIRSRIKGATESLPTDLLLYVGVQCGPPSSPNSTFLYSVDVFFGRYTDDGYLTVYYPGYGAFGTTDEDSLRNSLRERTEFAITDYLQANFDL